MDHHALVEIASPYANTRSAVRYVGDSACTRCHGKIAETYRRHPMGRSLSPIAAATTTGGDEAAGRPLFEAHGLEYSIERRDGRVLHQETRRDASGRIIARNEAEVQFVLGSGSQGIGYLIERDGFLFQSPISWYVREAAVGPGSGLRADRTSTSTGRSPRRACTATRTGSSRWRARSTGIGRRSSRATRSAASGATGPASFTSRRPTIVDGRDTTIVNPAGLESSLRDAVCEQCHLTGPSARREGGSSRGGLSARAAVRSSSGRCSSRPPARPRIASSARSSRCTRAVASAPARAGWAASPVTIRISGRSPRSRRAITGNGVWSATPIEVATLPSAVRLARSPTDDCAGCHMPRADRTDILHAATTNHRILRKPDGGDRSPIAPVEAASRRTAPGFVPSRADG